MADLNAALERSTRPLRLFAWSLAVFLLTLAVTAAVLREYRSLLEHERDEAAQQHFVIAIAASLDSGAGDGHERSSPSRGSSLGRRAPAR